MNKKQVRNEIRRFCGLPESASAFFTRREMLTIVRKYNKAAHFVSSKRGNHKYVPSKDLFPRFFPDVWVEQDTVNDQPSLINLIRIKNALLSLEEDEKTETSVVTLTNNVKTIESEDNPYLLKIAGELAKNASKIICEPSGKIVFVIK